MTTGRRRRAATGALLALAAGSVAVARARPVPGLDASRLPEARGTVKQDTLTPRGDVDGLVLADGTEVKLFPHLTGAIVFAIRPGDAVAVRGLRARAVPLVDGATVRNDATGATVADDGPPGRDAAEATLTARVVQPLHGRRGEVNGALLDDGTTLRLPPPEAARLADLLAPGRTPVG